MKEIIEERTVKETTKFIACDGTPFHVYGAKTAERVAEVRKQCEEYEKTALAVIGKRAIKIKIGDATSYDLTNGEGSDEYEVEIFKPTTAENIKDLQMYLENATGYGKMEIDDTLINKEVMVWWNYEKDGYTISTLETYMGTIKEAYYNAIERYKEENSEQG